MAPRRSTTGKGKSAARKPSAPYVPEFFSLEDSKDITPLDSVEVDLDLEAIRLGCVPASTPGRIEKLAKDRLASAMQRIVRRQGTLSKAVVQERSGWRVDTKSTPSRSRSATPEAVFKFQQGLQVPTSFPESNIRQTVDAEPTTSDRMSQDGRPQVEDAFPERTDDIREDEVSALLEAVEFEASPIAKSPFFQALGYGEEHALRRLPYPLNNKEFLRLYVAPLFELEMGCGSCSEGCLGQEAAMEQRKERLLDRLDRCEEIAVKAISVVDARRQAMGGVAVYGGIRQQDFLSLQEGLPRIGGSLGGRDAQAQKLSLLDVHLQIGTATGGEAGRRAVVEDADARGQHSRAIQRQIVSAHRLPIPVDALLTPRKESVSVGLPVADG